MRPSPSPTGRGFFPYLTFRPLNQDPVNLPNIWIVLSPDRAGLSAGRLHFPSPPAFPTNGERIFGHSPIGLPGVYFESLVPRSSNKKYHSSLLLVTMPTFHHLTIRNP